MSAREFSAYITNGRAEEEEREGRVEATRVAVERKSNWASPFPARGFSFSYPRANERNKRRRNNSTGSAKFFGKYATGIMRADGYIYVGNGAVWRASSISLAVV